MEIKIIRNNLGRFVKSCHASQATEFKKGHKIKSSGGFKKGYTPWNKGTKGVTGIWNKGRKLSEEHKLKISIRRVRIGKWTKGKKWSKENRIRHSIWLKHAIKNGLHPAFIKGQKAWNKSDLSYKECTKLYHQRRKAVKRNGGKLSIKTIQLVYEDNIKRFGTLTCYLCLQPIEFKQDSLEHKIPLSRSGTNEYNNLAIAHRKCNSKKWNKTPEEYKEYVSKSL